MKIKFIKKLFQKKKKNKKKKVRNDFPLWIGRRDNIDSCYIHPTAIISGDNFQLGTNCWIGGLSNISAGKAGITLGNNVVLSSYIILMTDAHDYKGSNALPFDQHVISSPILIEDNVWIGISSIILPGVKIGEGAIIGAGAVISKSIPKCAIVAGNPAKIVGYRDENKYNQLKNEKKFINSTNLPEEEIVVSNNFKKQLSTTL